MFLTNESTAPTDDTVLPFKTTLSQTR